MNEAQKGSSLARGELPRAARSRSPVPPAQRTFFDFGCEKLASLCRELCPNADPRPLLDLFGEMVRPWGEQKIGTSPRRPSDVADDEAPFEFCMAFSSGRPEIQVYLEPQGEPPTARSNRLAARALLDRLADSHGAALDDFRRLEDLLLGREPGPPFSLWIGLSWSPGRPPLFKAYLNLHARGRDLAEALTASALDRLGHGRAWSSVQPLLSSSEGRAEPAILCLDLSRGDERRAKVYVRHRNATLPDIEAFAALTGELSPHDIRQFYLALAGSTGPFLRKPPITEVSFVKSRPERPLATTLEFPVAHYTDDDEVARRRIERCFAAFGLSCEAYGRAIEAFAARHLASRAGLHAHVTLRRVADGPRIALYLASEAYRVEREVG